MREGGPWSGSVLALLRHFEDAGFDGAPRIVGDGLDAAGRELLTYLPGSTPHPYAWPDPAMPALGELLRRAHDAGRGFVPAAEPSWRPWFGRGLLGDDPVIGHGDPGPWNVVAGGDGLPYALIDWEFSGPVDAVWELAHAAWLNAQLHDDDLADVLGLPPAAARAAQVALLLDGYGLPAARRAGFVDKMIETAVRSARAEAVDHAVDQDSTRAVTSTGYPLLWAITWRARDAAWMLDQRSLLERAIT